MAKRVYQKKVSAILAMVFIALFSNCVWSA